MIITQFSQNDYQMQKNMEFNKKLSLSTLINKAVALETSATEYIGSPIHNVTVSELFKCSERSVGLAIK